MINVSGAAQVRPTAMAAAYGAAKAGVGKLHRVARPGVGAVQRAGERHRARHLPDPEQTDAATLAEREATQANSLAIPRFGRLRECGLLAAYLASDAAAYITGQTVVIDGGRTIAP